MECEGGEVDGQAREGQRWDSTYQTCDFANSTALWFSGSQMLSSLVAVGHCLPPSPEAIRAKLTGKTHAVLRHSCSHLFGGWVLGAVLHCLLTARTDY